ncbi:hypothetical protein HDU67_004431, partial [Dinochytrium kinnereticum]
YHDNIYIKTGYRRIQYTYRGCYRSLFYLHNETGNVYTHLFGALLFLLLVPLSFFKLFDWVVPVLETTTGFDVAVMM